MNAQALSLSRQAVNSGSACRDTWCVVLRRPAPVSNRHDPFFRQFPDRQVEGLEQNRGDCTPTVQSPEAAVQALYGIGRIHDLPDGLRELKHGAGAVSVVTPAFRASRIFGRLDCTTSSRRIRSVRSSGA